MEALSRLGHHLDRKVPHSKYSEPPSVLLYFIAGVLKEVSRAEFHNSTAPESGIEGDT